MPRAEDVFPVLGKCQMAREKHIAMGWTVTVPCDGTVVRIWQHNLTKLMPDRYALCTRCGTVDGAYEETD